MAHPVTWFLTPASVALALTLFSPLRAQDAPPPDQGSPAAQAPANGAPGAPTADSATGPVEDTISFQTFYDNLAPMGTWIQTNDYGYVWQPNVTDPNWAPYTLGHWAYTDDGWTWMSDEPFGWATYHYGRWANLQNVGWVWVPGYVWAPAWVSWRTSEDTVGWAPLPPDSMAGVDYSQQQTQTDSNQVQDQQPAPDMGYEIGSDVDEYYGIGPGYYIFLPISFICWHDYRGHWCDRHDNWNLINHTHNVTNTTVHRHGAPGEFGRVKVGGPDINLVNSKSQTPIQRLSLTRTKTVGNGNVNGNSLSVFAPHVGAGASTSAKPTQVASTIGQVKLNRGVDASETLAVNSHLSPGLPTQDQLSKARMAQSEAPASAKTLTDASTLGTAPRSPLTTMRPIINHGSAPAFNTQGAQGQGLGQRQVQGQGQAFTPQSRGYQNAAPSPNPGGTQFNQQRIYQPSQQVYQTQPQGEGHVQQQQGQVFNSTPGHGAVQQQQRQESSGVSAGGTHVFQQNNAPIVHQSAPVVHESAPVVHESAPVVHQSAPAPSESRSSGGGESSGGHGSYSAPSASSSGGSSGGGNSSGGSSGGGGASGIRGH